MGKEAIVPRLATGFVAALLLAPAVIIGSVEPAMACSCGGAEVSWFIENSDVGFIGTFQGSSDHPDPSTDGRDDRIATFTVSEWFDGDPDPHLDGDTVQVSSPSSGGACGFELRPGQEAAIFADRRGDGLVGGLCSTLDAGVVRAYLTPPELGGGEAVLAVPGRFDRGGMALLDAQGQLIGYDSRFSFTWVPQVVSCPEGSTAILIDAGRALVVDLDDLSLRRQVDLGDLLDEATLASVACRDPLGQRVDVVLERWQGDGSAHELRSLDTIDQPGRELALPTSARPTLAGDHVVVQTYLDPGERLVVVDPDGDQRTTGELLRTAEDDHRGYVGVDSGPVGADPGVEATQLVAVLEGDYADTGVTSRLWLLDLATGEEVVSRTIDEETWQVRWLDAERLLLIVGGEEPARAEVIAADTLEPIGAVDGWWDGGAVLVGDALWASGGGSIVTGPLGGERRQLASLPTTEAGPLLALASPIDIEPSAPDRPPVTVITPTPDTASVDDPTDDPIDQQAGPGPMETGPPSGGLPLIPGAVGATGLAAAGFLLLRHRTRRGPPAPADDDSMRS